MKYRYPMPAMVLACAAWGVSAAHAQDGHVFAGRFFETLYAALDMEYLRLDQTELRYQILERRLAAIVIPQAQRADEFVIYRADRQSTKLSKLTLSQEDLERLRSFANDGIFVALGAVRSTPQDPKSVALLQQRVQKLPAAQRASAERFVGAQLADMNLPQDHELAGYVQHYRNHVEQRTLDHLRNPDFARELQEGVPHAFGSQSISHSQLQPILGKNVETITVGDRAYQKTWVEGALVVVPVPKSPTGQPPTSAGTGSIRLAPEVVNKIKPGSGGETPVKHGRTKHK